MERKSKEGKERIGEDVWREYERRTKLARTDPHSWNFPAICQLTLTEQTVDTPVGERFLDFHSRLYRHSEMSIN